MTAKTKKPASAGKSVAVAAVTEPDAAADRAGSDHSELRIQCDPEDSTEVLVAKMALGPMAASALTAKTFTKLLFGPTTMADAYAALRSSIASVESGKLNDAEAMLIAQATALNAIFNELAMRAHGQSQIKNLEAFLRLSLKAQAQCRMTLETLATIKNPPIVFARQANIAHGPQQVNNAAAPAPVTHAAEIESKQPGLLEASHVDPLAADVCPQAFEAGSPRKSSTPSQQGHARRPARSG